MNIIDLFIYKLQQNPKMLIITTIMVAQLAGTVEYTDCISAEV